MGSWDYGVPIPKDWAGSSLLQGTRTRETSQFPRIRRPGQRSRGRDGRHDSRQLGRRGSRAEARQAVLPGLRTLRATSRELCGTNGAIWRPRVTFPKSNRPWPKRCSFAAKAIILQQWILRIHHRSCFDSRDMLLSNPYLGQSIS